MKISLTLAQDLMQEEKKPQKQLLLRKKNLQIPTGDLQTIAGGLPAIRWQKCQR